MLPRNVIATASHSISSCSVWPIRAMYANDLEYIIVVGVDSNQQCESYTSNDAILDLSNSV